MNNHQILAKIIILYRINTYVMMYTKRYQYIIPLIIWNNTERYIHLRLSEYFVTAQWENTIMSEKRKAHQPIILLKASIFVLQHVQWNLTLYHQHTISSHFLSLLQLLQIKASLLLSRILVRFENSIKSNKSWFKS